MSVYDQQKEEIDNNINIKTHICLKRGVNKADATFFLSTRCYQKPILDIL